MTMECPQLRATGTGVPGISARGTEVPGSEAFIIIHFGKPVVARQLKLFEVVDKGLLASIFD